VRQAVALKNFYLLLKLLLVPSNMYETCAFQWNGRIDNYIDNYVVKLVKLARRLANTTLLKQGMT
jgi:hypothetical protein